MAFWAPGHSRRAHRAATPLMSPSTTTGTRQAAPPRKAPHRAARSSPPTLASTSRGSAGSGRLIARAASTAATLRARPASDSPAPRPVSSAAGRPSRAQATAAEVVVLPIPISPVQMSRAPRSACSRTSSAPVRTAFLHCSRVMAGPAAQSPVPLATRQSRTPGAPGKSSIPMSTGRTAHRATAAIRQTVLSPAPRARATEAVTSGPHWVTPRATTPLSAQNTSRVRGESCSSSSPVRAATRTRTSSRRPRLPRGLATRSQWARAAAAAPSSGGVIWAIQSLSSILFPPSVSAGRRPRSAGPGATGRRSADGERRRTDWARHSHSASSPPARPCPPGGHLRFR